MKKAKIYKPSKTAMQSGYRNSKQWILKFDTLNTGTNPLTGWQTSRDTMSEVILSFTSKDQAINYAKKNNIDFINFKWSGRQDLNLRPSGPKPDALPGCATPRIGYFLY